MDSAEVISWTRLIVLFGALGIAAWLDHKERRVPNDFWITWSKPAIFLWTLDLLVSQAQWYVYATAAGMVAYASIAVIGRPTIKNTSNGYFLVTHTSSTPFSFNTSICAVNCSTVGVFLGALVR